jgi:predicted transcriptional regulator
MKLKDHLNKNHISMTSFSKKIDRNTSTVSRICAGEVRPDWSTMEKILVATGGKVKPNDFL